MKKLVSVNMGVYNEEIRWLEASIASVLDQTYRNFEFIIVYDNPENKEILEFLKGKAQLDARIKVHVNEVNAGLSYSLNKALFLSSGEYVMKLDADDVCIPERLERQLSYLESQGLDVVSSSYKYIDEDGNFTGNGPTGLPSRAEDVRRLLPIANFIAHPSVLYKRAVVAGLEGYRPFPMSVDYDLWLRVLAGGYKIGVLEEPLILYRVRSGSVSHKDKLKLYLVIEYQQAQYRQRLAKGKDSFSVENLETYLKKRGYHDEKVKKAFYLAEKEYGNLRDKSSRETVLKRIPDAMKMVTRSGIFSRYLYRFYKYRTLRKIHVGR